MKEMLKELTSATNHAGKARLALILQQFHDSYLRAIRQSGGDVEAGDRLFKQLTAFVIQQTKHPYSFGLFHQSIRQPFDYYQFGLDFIRPLIDFQSSKVLGLEHFQRIKEQIAKKENVILLANHQTEPDPQIISLLLEANDPHFASEIIFVAGHRVIEDPMAIPLSMGRNLLCIYSRKHISHPPEDKPRKVSHNQRTMKKMSDLLSEGGKCIYVAPSGGRDRIDANEKLEPAPFDPDSLEMFWLMAQQASQQTHFYPLALFTYPLLPPPREVEKELGERREAAYTPVHLAFGQELDMEHFTNDATINKKEKRRQRADYIWKLVCQDYHRLLT